MTSEVQMEEGRPRARTSRAPEVKLAAVATLAALFASIVVGEAVLSRRRQRLAFPFHNQLQPYVEFASPPDYTWSSDGPSPSSRSGDRAVVYTNHDGLRVPAPGYALARRKPAGQVRIVLLGGSTVNVGTTFDVTLPGAVRRQLRQRFPGRDIEVMNAGIISAIARQQLIHLLLTIVDYDVDILVNYDGINDSGQMLYFEKRPNHPYNFHLLEEAWRQYVDERREPLWRLVLGRSAIAASLWPGRFGDRHRAHGIAPEAIVASAELRESYATAYVDNWHRIGRVAAAYGIRPFFVLQPTSLYALFVDGRQRAPVESRLEANYLVYEAYRRAVRAFAVRHPDATTLDLADFLPDTAYFYDGCHVYDEVNDRIAGRLAALLQPAVSDLLARR